MAEATTSDASVPARPRIWFAFAAVPVLAAHVGVAIGVGTSVATVGEARLAASVAIARGAAVTADPLPLSDRWAALQLALVETVLPVADIPVVDAARWACLLLGTLTALLLWPILRALGIATPAAALGVVALGALPPVLAAHVGIAAAAPAAAWLALATAFTARRWTAAACGAAALAGLTAPLVLAMLLALAAYLMFDRTLRRSDRYRKPIGAFLAIAAIAVAGVSIDGGNLGGGPRGGAAVGGGPRGGAAVDGGPRGGAAVDGGPLGGAAGPEVGIGVAVATLVIGLAVLVLADRAARWLRPVLVVGALLLVFALVPGSSRTTALLLAAPVLAVAAAVAAERLGERYLAPAAAVTLALLLVPVGAAFTAPPLPRDPGLVGWLGTEPAPDTPIRADALDRVELAASGIGVGRLRRPDDPRTLDELLLVTARPAAGAAPPARCTAGSVLATTPRGTGGSPAAVCRAAPAAPRTAQRDTDRVARARFGVALADNPALTLSPAAATALRDGGVDARLMLVITAMTTAHEIAIADFPLGALDSPDTARRQAVFTGIDGTPSATSDLLRTWLAAQQPPFVPSVVRPLGSDLLVGFPAPSPSGLLPE